MGGGRRELLDSSTLDPEYGDEGDRTDGRNIVEEWMEGKDPNRAKYVWNLDQFNAVDPDNTDYLMGKVDHVHE